MDEKLFKIIIALIPVLMAIVTGYVVPLLKTKVGDARLNNIVKWIKYAIQAAELIYQNETGKGLEKKQFVIDFINNMFNSKKEVVTEQQISVIIESLVNELEGITINTYKYQD